MDLFDFAAQRDGQTYNPTRDGKRLADLHSRVFEFMRPGQWVTLAELVAECGGTEASVGARTRDMRKAKFGGHTVERRYVSRGLFEYRLIVKG